MTPGETGDDHESPDPVEPKKLLKQTGSIMMEDTPQVHQKSAASFDLRWLAGNDAERILPSASRSGEAFNRLAAIVMRLRSPDGCPWDREQRPATLRSNIVEEAYELVEAIDEKDSSHIAEECGDLVLLAAMVASILEEEGKATMAGALDLLSEKLVRRHPHVFADSTVNTSDAVVTQWNQIKETVEGRGKKNSILDGLSRALPPLERAYKVQKKTAKAGFDWESPDGSWEKLEEEIAEAREACENLAEHVSDNSSAREKDSGRFPEHEDKVQEHLRARLEDEIGDMLFSIVNVARKYDVDPSLALGRTIDRYSRRFRHVERRMAEAGVPMKQGNLEIMDRFWNEAKAEERQ